MTCLLLMLLLWTPHSSLAAREGMMSEPYALANGRSLVLSTHETWNGKTTQTAVDVLVTGLSAQPQLLHQQMLFETSFNVGATSAAGVYPAILSAVEEGDNMAVLWKTMPMGTTENGHYLLLNRDGDAYRSVNSLEISALLPSSRSVSPRPPQELSLKDLRQVHLLHHDGFAVDIAIAPDNSVTINGKPAAPNNAPIRRLHYRLFLNALSPATAQSYDVPLRDGGPVPWWVNPSLRPPFSFADYSEMSRLISWITPPAIDPATIPPELQTKPAPPRPPGAEEGPSAAPSLDASAPSSPVTAPKDKP